MTEKDSRGITRERTRNIDDIIGEVCAGSKPYLTVEKWQMMCDGTAPDGLPHPDFLYEVLNARGAGVTKAIRQGGGWTIYAESPRVAGAGPTPSHALLLLTWRLLDLVA